jgi:hypothetical protein
VVPLLFSFLCTFSTLGVKVTLLMMMTTNTKSSETVSRVLLWAAGTILPQCLLAMVALSRAMGCQLLPVLTSFPALLATPLFTPLTFGRAGRHQGAVAFSLNWTLANILATMVGGTAVALVGHLHFCVNGAVLTLMVVMALAMLPTVPLIIAATHPDSVLARLFQRGVLKPEEPEAHFVLDNKGKVIRQGVWEMEDRQLAGMVQEMGAIGAGTAAVEIIN